MDSCIQQYATENNILSKNLKGIYLNLRQIMSIFDELIESQQEKTVSNVIKIYSDQ